MRFSCYTKYMKTVVGVLRGGPSSEYDVSLKTGASVISNLNQEKYSPRDIFVDRTGVWHLHGAPVSPAQALSGIDVIFNAMHGEFGEDGQVQRLLDTVGVPYTGSGATASALAFNKHLTKQEIKKFGIKTPRALVVERENNTAALAQEIFRSFPHPAVIKPVASGSSVGVTIADNFHALEVGLEKAFAISDKALVEEFIKGREATVGVIDGFRGEKTYVLMPIEIIPPKENTFYDYEAKYVSDNTGYRIPGHFTDHEKKTLEDMARTVHEGLGLAHYSRSDFIVSPRGVYFLEVNTLPGMTSHSLIPKGVEAVGSKFTDFLDHLLTLAQAGTKN